MGCFRLNNFVNQTGNQNIGAGYLHIPCIVLVGTRLRIGNGGENPAPDLQLLCIYGADGVGCDLFKIPHQRGAFIYGAIFVDNDNIVLIGTFIGIDSVADKAFYLAVIELYQRFFFKQHRQLGLMFV